MMQSIKRKTILQIFTFILLLETGNQVACETAAEPEDASEDGIYWLGLCLILKLLKAIAFGMAGASTLTVLLTLAGFTTSGIAASSFAAYIQAKLGAVAAGSLFAYLQSFGAIGAFVLFGPLWIIGMFLFGGAFWSFTSGCSDSTMMEHCLKSCSDVTLEENPSSFIDAICMACKEFENVYNT